MKRIRPPWLWSYATLIGVYLTLCFLVLIVSQKQISDRLQDSTFEQTNTVIGLMTEKINNSLDMMSGYALEAAELVPMGSEQSLSLLWKMHNSDGKLPYTGIGTVDMDGEIHGKPGEISDLIKYDLAKAAIKKNALFISEPYRSCVSGENVLTMFAPYLRDGETAGYVFVTYPLHAIQDMAQSKILPEECEIYLMNAFSCNIINCNQTVDAPAGSWNNTRLTKRRLTASRGYHYDTWEDSMREGQERGILQCIIDGKEYVQAFQRIDSMDGWFIVIRIPGRLLSGGMASYSGAVRNLAVVIGGITLLMMLAVLKKEVQQRKELTKISSMDSLTMLANRRAFQKMADDYFEKTSHPHCVLMFFDVDHFKEVNDTYGHATGDSVLRSFAGALHQRFGTRGIVAREGGDEFIVFVRDYEDRNSIDHALDSLRGELLNVPIGNDRLITVTFSAGLAAGPEDGKTLAELKQNADQALYYVKKNGRNSYCWYQNYVKNSQQSAESPSDMN